MCGILNCISRVPVLLGTARGNLLPLAVPMRVDVFGLVYSNSPLTFIGEGAAFVI